MKLSYNMTNNSQINDPDAKEPIISNDLRLPNIHSKRRGRSIKLKKRKTRYSFVLFSPFILDCCKPSGMEIPEYDSLLDPYMGGFFLNPRIKHHLVNMKIVP